MDVVTLLTTQEWFDEWAKKYDEYLPHFPIYKKLIRIVVDNADIPPGAKVLDIGIGTGNTSLSIFNKTPCKITGVDISDEMMNIARAKAKEMGAELELINSSADKMELEGTFDLAVAAFTIHHLEVKQKLEAFKKISQHLREGGRLILVELTLDVDGDIKSEKRLKHMLRRWGVEAQYALKYVGPEGVGRALNALIRAYYRDGECIETREKWFSLLKEAGFKVIKNEKPDEKIGWEVFVCEKEA